MKIFIDSTVFKVYEWTDGRMGAELLNYYGQYNALSFQSFVDKILTPSQLYIYVTGDSDRVFTLSKKKERIMLEEIPKLKAKNSQNANRH